MDPEETESAAPSIVPAFGSYPHTTAFDCWGPGTRSGKPCIRSLGIDILVCVAHAADRERKTESLTRVSCSVTNMCRLRGSPFYPVLRTSRLDTLNP